MGEGDVGEGLRLEEEFIAVSNTPWAEGPANFLYKFLSINFLIFLEGIKGNG